MRITELIHFNGCTLIVKFYLTGEFKDPSEAALFALNHCFICKSILKWNSSTLTHRRLFTGAAECHRIDDVSYITSLSNPAVLHLCWRRQTLSSTCISVELKHCSWIACWVTSAPRFDGGERCTDLKGCCVMLSVETSINFFTKSDTQIKILIFILVHTFHRCFIFASEFQRHRINEFFFRWTVGKTVARKVQNMENNWTTTKLGERVG